MTKRIMKLNINKFWLATSFSLCCLLVPKTVTAQEVFLSSGNIVDIYQQTALTSVTEITKNGDIVGSNLEEKFMLSSAYFGKNTNNVIPNVESTVSKNVELKTSVSKQTTGLAAKGGKKPPRKG